MGPKELTGSKKYGTKHLICLLFKENRPSSWEDTKKMNKVKALSKEEYHFILPKNLKQTSNSVWRHRVVVPHGRGVSDASV